MLRRLRRCRVGELALAEDGQRPHRSHGLQAPQLASMPQLGNRLESSPSPSPALRGLVHNSLGGRRGEGEGWGRSGSVGSRGSPPPSLSPCKRRREGAGPLVDRSKNE
jgi:hypothetical protein